MDSHAQENFHKFSDFHIHIDDKHNDRPKDVAIMDTILKGTKYDRKSGKISFNPKMTAYVLGNNNRENDNWTKYVKKPKDLIDGKISDLRNYDQASYAEICTVPGSILCNSIYPFEKQFAIGGFRRFISSMVVTKMGLKRLSKYATNDYYPMKDFMSEYYYTLMQDSCKRVVLSHKKYLYNTNYNNDVIDDTIVNIIKLVKDNDELQSALKFNDSHKDTLITSMVLTIEGGQVLYGPISGKEENIMDPLDTTKVTRETVQNELLHNVDSLKSFPHHLFFITLGHFAQNHVVGFAKTIDRDPENFQHRIPGFLANFPYLRNNVLFPKNYDGFNENNGIGLKIARRFLDPQIGTHNKPTFIDVKHMDIKARVQYYYQRRDWEKELSIKIPIVASHFGVSGERQAMAAATGLRPNYDKYEENEDTKEFYQNSILDNPDASYESSWKGFFDGCKEANPRGDTLSAADRAVYIPLNFSDSFRTRRNTFIPSFDPFENYKIDQDNNIGWYYTWSLNLFDEEIIEIDKSDGIIGLLLDPRQLGAYAQNYKHSYYSKIKPLFRYEKQNLVSNIRVDLGKYGLVEDDLNEIEYLKCEPLIRNIFYIARLIRQQQAADSGLATYSWYVPDTLKAKKDPWKLIAIGSDFDGYIDPIDLNPTAAYMPLLRTRMIVYAYIFALIHREEFQDPVTHKPLINSLEDSEQKMEQIFFSNGKTFITTYF